LAPIWNQGELSTIKIKIKDQEQEIPRKAPSVCSATLPEGKVKGIVVAASDNGGRKSQNSSTRTALLSSESQGDRLGSVGFVPLLLEVL